MKLTLILAGPYNSCIATKDVWQQSCTKHNIDIEVTDLDDKKGQAITADLELKSFPALIYNNKVIAVGHPDIQTADKIISDLVQQE
ncbi:MAG: hypothetical protein OEW97_00610 [Gammaproteobacteria bacterium]|nr:hypothetical protein [Gammaproteobacteria bacterium]